MSLEKDFPVLSGAQQEKRKQEQAIVLESKRKGKDYVEKALRSGKTIAKPLIAAILALGSVKEGKSQTSNRVLSLDKAIEAKVGDTISLQENDSTVHLFKKLKQRDDGTLKIRDLGRIKTTKGDAVKVEDMGNQDHPIKNDKDNDGVNFKNLPGYMDNGRYKIKYGDNILSFDTPQHAAEAQAKLKISPVLNKKNSEKINYNLDNIDPTTLTGYSKDGIWGFEYKGKVLKFDTVDHMRQAAKSLNLSLK